MVAQSNIRYRISNIAYPCTSKASCHLRQPIKNREFHERSELSLAVAQSKIRYRISNIAYPCTSEASTPGGSPTRPPGYKTKTETAQPSEEDQAVRYRQGSDKPGSVISHECESSTIYPGPELLPGSIYLPVVYLRTDGPPAAANDNTTARYFNPRGLPTLHITVKRRALLPHVFTLTSRPKAKGGIAFCGTFRILRIRRTPAVSRRGALRCPDFPLAVFPKEPPAVEWTCLRGENVFWRGEVDV